MAPPHEEIVRNRTTIHFFGYYKFWDPQENFYYCTENTGFSPNPERSEGTYSKYASLDDRVDGYHYYLAYIKFGIGQDHVRCRARNPRRQDHPRGGRRAGQALRRGVSPQSISRSFSNTARSPREQFSAVIDSWRSPHLWERSDGDWRLRHVVWDPS